MPEIGLTEALRGLRAELIESMAEADGQEVQFRLGPVDVEFQVALQETVAGEAGVKFWVVNAGAKASDSTTTTHTVRIQLNPATKDGLEVWTGDRVEEFPN